MEPDTLLAYYTGLLTDEEQAEVQRYLNAHPEQADEMQNRLLLFDQLLPDARLMRLHQVWETLEDGRHRLSAALYVVYQDGQLSWAGLPAGLRAHILRPGRAQRGAQVGSPPEALVQAARRILRGEELLQPPEQLTRGSSGRRNTLDLILIEPDSTGRLVLQITLQPAGRVLFRFELACQDELGKPNQRYTFLELWFGEAGSEDFIGRFPLEQGAASLTHLEPGDYRVNIAGIYEIPLLMRTVE